MKTPAALLQRLLALPPATWLATGVLLPVAAVAAALYTQHHLDMQPCPWCVLQRLIFLAIALSAALAWLLRPTLARRLAAGLMALLALCGIAAALWQHFVATHGASCNMTLADRIVRATGLDERFPDVFVAWASCAEAAVTLLGLPYEFYSLALFVLLLGVALRVMLRPHPAPPTAARGA